jgi:hypothetical protein
MHADFTVAGGRGRRPGYNEPSTCLGSPIPNAVIGIATSAKTTVLADVKIPEYVWGNGLGTVRVLGRTATQEANKPLTFTRPFDPNLSLKPGGPSARADAGARPASPA